MVITIPPVIGSPVLFWQSRELELDRAQPEAATVTYVHSESLVNLQVINHNGHARSECSVYLWQSGGPEPHFPYCKCPDKPSGKGK